MILQLIKKYILLRQFIKFCLVGGVAAIIHFILLYTLTEWVQVWYVVSTTVGGTVSAAWNFFANKFWTFRNKQRGRQAMGQVIKFAVVISSGVVLNTIIVYLVTDFGGLDYRLSWVIATGIVTFWNFGLNRFWTFQVHTTPEPPIAF